MTSVRRLSIDEVDVVHAIDRAEHVDVQYAVVDGALVEVPVVMADVPSWYPDGDGEHSVANYVAFCRDRMAEGGALLGAFGDGGDVLGLAIVHPVFEPPMAWLSFLHVSRPHRRGGVASALWDAAITMAGDAGAESIYVSATPTGSAVGFYLSRGSRLASPPHPTLFALEPEDIHLVCPLR